MLSAVARRRVLVRAPAWRPSASLPHQRWASTVVSSNLNSVTEQDLAHFSSFLAPSSILSTLSPSNTPADELTPFNDDWMGKYKGKSTTVLKPRTTEEVSKIVKYCNEKRIGIVPQGGNTGLVGGSVPVKDEVVLSLSNLNKIRSFDPVSGNVTFITFSPPIPTTDPTIRNTGSGCRLYLAIPNRLPCSTWSHHAHRPRREREVRASYHSFQIYPVQLPALSCHIGGNVSTNAGGLRLLRYGSLHGAVLGLEVVMPDGTILNQLSTLRKDNTGKCLVCYGGASI